MRVCGLGVAHVKALGRRRSASTICPERLFFMKSGLLVEAVS
jgi:hypothetical protein